MEHPFFWADVILHNSAFNLRFSAKILPRMLGIKYIFLILSIFVNFEFIFFYLPFSFRLFKFFWYYLILKQFLFLDNYFLFVKFNIFSLILFLQQIFGISNSIICGNIIYYQISYTKDNIY